MLQVRISSTGVDLPQANSIAYQSEELVRLRDAPDVDIKHIIDVTSVRGVMFPGLFSTGYSQNQVVPVQQLSGDDAED